MDQLPNWIWTCSCYVWPEHDIQWAMTVCSIGLHIVGLTMELLSLTLTGLQLAASPRPQNSSQRRALNFVYCSTALNVCSCVLTVVGLRVVYMRVWKIMARTMSSVTPLNWGTSTSWRPSWGRGTTIQPLPLPALEGVGFMRAMSPLRVEFTTGTDATCSSVRAMGPSQESDWDQGQLELMQLPNLTPADQLL